MARNKKEQTIPIAPNSHQVKTWQWWIEKVFVPILLALLSGFFLLLSSGIIENPFLYQTIPTVTDSPVSSLGGMWSGSGTISTPAQEMDIDAGVEIHTPCEINAVCGEVYIHTIVCSYPLIYLREKENLFYFQQGEFIGPCGKADLIYFELRPNGDLLFHSEGETGTTEVTLIKN